ncbi:hypothetical protein [Clostridium psychrophilum]|uniref:hypothetical protein n=1 Tax=Clostridium psychrophilum TaxID=132926 RepID=UPI001C0E32F7|nr:hypothetical protein [Clostridium psychrophilum]MBU3181783.1 hypothetical protein [Clostridium psychrophilum]
MKYIYKYVFIIKRDALTMEESDTFARDNKKRTKIIPKQDLIKQELGERKCEFSGVVY